MGGLASSPLSQLVFLVLEALNSEKMMVLWEAAQRTITTKHKWWPPTASRESTLPLAWTLKVQDGGSPGTITNAASFTHSSIKPHTSLAGVQHTEEKLDAVLGQSYPDGWLSPSTHQQPWHCHEWCIWKCPLTCLWRDPSLDHYLQCLSFKVILR